MIFRNLLRKTYLDLFGKFSKPVNGVHILNSHFITPYLVDDSHTRIFESFIKYLKSKTKIVDIDTSLELIENSKSLDCPHVSFTFDDGFEECSTLISPILKSNNIKAAFFINANYVESNELYMSKFNDRIQTYTKKPMNWSQIENLLNDGHIIGSHSLDHFDFGKISKKEINFQLQSNKEILENKLNYKCDYFAWTYGQFQNFPKNALNIALKYHKYIFSATNHRNYFSYDGKVINRRHIEPFWNTNHIDYFLSKKSKL